MSTDTDSHRLATEAALIDLQSRLAFQEDTLRVMSEQMARQQETLAIAQRQIQHLHDKLRDLQDFADQRSQTLPQERPPHY